MLNSIIPSLFNDRSKQMYELNPLSEKDYELRKYEYEAHGAMLKESRQIKNTGIMNNLMLEKVLENQDKIMKKLDIEA